MRRVQVGRGVTSTAPGAGQELPLARRCPGGSGPFVRCVRPPARLRGPRRAFLSLGGAIRPGLRGAGAKRLSRSSAYTAEQRL